jgi:hypothetical protein
MLLWAARITLLLAVISAVVLARRRVDHRAFAAFIAWVAGANALRWALAKSFGLLRPPGLPPFVGAARAAFHVDQAIELSWSAGLAALVIVVFSRRRWFVALIGLVWTGAVAYLATHYPEVRGEALLKGYFAAELATVTVAAGLIITWTWRREPPTPARICVLCVCIADLITLLAGAWRWGYWIHWELNQVAFALTYATIAVYQVIIWRRISSLSSPR